jgi:hypothetical protein
MNAKTRLIALMACMTALTACFREDDKITLPPSGSAQVGNVAMGSDYANQTFYSLRNGAVLTNQFAAWDLAFESSPDGFHVWLNGGKNMLAGLTAYTQPSYLTDTTGIVWKWDESSWNPDSTAIGNWLSGAFSNDAYASMPGLLKTDANERFSNGRVYVIDRGATYSNQDRFWKVVFRWYNDEAYKLVYARLDNSFADSLVLDKDPNETYTYFTFDNGGQNIVMEPQPVEWDFLFTRYRYIFYNTNPYTPYLVTGVLLNPQNTAGAVDSTKAYDEIDYNYAHQLTLSTARDIIGYRWKAFNFDTQMYEVRTNYTYIVRDRDGYYWKLRFLDFYNDQGEKGNPKFEYQRL